MRIEENKNYLRFNVNRKTVQEFDVTAHKSNIVLRYNGQNFEQYTPEKDQVRVNIDNKFDKKKLAQFINDGNEVIAVKDNSLNKVHCYYFKFMELDVKSICVEGDTNIMYDKYVISTASGKFIYAVIETAQLDKDKTSLSFYLTDGTGAHLHCYVASLTSGTDYMNCKRIAMLPKQHCKYVLLKVDHDFSFSNEPVKASLTLVESLSPKGGYMKIWESYGRQLIANRITKMLKCDFLKIINRTGDRFVFTSDKDEKQFIKDLKEMVGGIDSDDTSNRLYCYGITDIGYEYIEKIRNSEDSQTTKDNNYYRLIALNEYNGVKLNTKETVRVYISVKDNKIFISDKKGSPIIADEIRDSIKYLMIGDDGFFNQIGKQIANMNSILAGDVKMPRLNDILSLIDKSKNTFFDFPNSKVKRAAFKPVKMYNGNRLNKAQQLAIESIYNTPDIVIVQGPPGTGKTAVIRAAMKAIEDQSSDVLKNLLTTQQHVALDNAADGLMIKGVPCQRGHSGEDGKVVNITNNVIKFSDDLANSVKVKYPNFKPMKLLYDIDALKTKLSMGQKTRYYIDTLVTCIFDEIEKDHPSIRTSSLILRSKLRRLTVDYKSEGNNIMYNELLHYISRLPENRMQLTDDYHFDVDAIKTHVSNNDHYINSVNGFVNTINKCTKKVDGVIQVTDAGIAEIRKAKRNFTADVVFSHYEDINVSEGQIDAIMALLDELRENVYHSAYEGMTSTEKAINDYVNSVLYKRGEIIKVVKKYSKYVAVSHNQIENYKLIKSLDMDIATQEYSNVFVDEAARSSALDLAMVLGKVKNRIVLVGDDMQLPQFIDEDAFKDISGEEDDKLSLFTKLKNVAIMLQEKDGINRFVFLNEQFRTNCILGDFVSNNFYKGELKNANTPMQSIMNIVGYEGVCGVYKEINNGKCAENNNFSKFRKSEAEWIAEDIKKLILSNAEKKLSIGIISSYKAQIEAIREELVAADLCEKKSNKYVVKFEYLDKVKCIETGTLDSYQGREFDVVYNSLVIDTGKVSKFVNNFNRNCVAFSRQKKLLILVGSSNVKFLERAIYANKFYENCKNKVEGYKLVESI